MARTSDRFTFTERRLGTFRTKSQDGRLGFDRVFDMLKSFTPEDRADMVKDGKIVVTCEFCGRVYPFDPGEVETETK